MYFIDSHAHLTEDSFDTDRNTIINTLFQNKISKVITIGCTIREAKKAIQLSKTFKNVYPVVGLYPSGTEDNEIEIGTKRTNPKYEKLLLESLKQLLKTEKNIVGIGECGLDYTSPPPWEIKRTKKAQQNLFESQIELAIAQKKPLVIHSRNAKEDTIAILQNNYKKHSKRNGVWHCYSENLEIAKIVIDLGFYISVSGLITYNNTEQLAKAVTNIPLERILIETDSPFLVPKNKRKEGIKRNEPKYVKIIAQKVAELKAVSLETVALQTTKNVENLFNI